MRGPSPNRDAAMRYAAHGWPVFPVRADDPLCAGMADPHAGCECKAPLSSLAPHGFKDAETDSRTVSRWWSRHPDANVGIATGAPGPDVLDVDVKHVPGYRYLNEAIRAQLVPSPMATVRTTSGGAHLYYQGTSQRNGSLPLQGLDFRSTGGYVLAPPSAVHGKPYLLASHGGEPATIDWNAIKAHFQPGRHWQPASSQHQGSDAGLSELAVEMASTPSGDRNNTLFRMACRCIRAGDRDALSSIAGAAVTAGLPLVEVANCIRSAHQQVRLAAGRPKGPDREAG